MFRTSMLLGLFCLSLLGCDDAIPDLDVPELDAGQLDAASSDAALDASPSDADSVLDGSRDSATAMDAASADAGMGSSGGSGEVACTRMGSLGSGRSYCEASLGSVDVRFITPLGGSGPLRLALYLHGDGAGAYNSGSVLRVLAPWADAHHALVVAALAPNGCAWWQTPTHDCALTTSDPDVDHLNATALAAALETLRSRYDVLDAPVFYYGSSGGSVFLTASFFPRWGNQYPGILAVNCGGEAPWPEGFLWSPSSDVGTELHFTYGDMDFLREDAHAAAEYYRGEGFTVTETILTPDVTHCAFDGHGRAAEVWSAALGE